jgi:surface antigen
MRDEPRPAPVITPGTAAYIYDGNPRAAKGMRAAREEPETRTMNGKKLAAVLMLTAALPLGACADMQANPKTTAGTLVGAGTGALIGSQFGGGSGQLITTAIGALAGAWAGGEVGKSLDRADRLAMQDTTQRSLETAPTRQPTQWRNPDTGNYGSVTPTRTFQSASGEACREYQQTITVGGRTEEGYGTACRQPDGTWKIVQ